MDDKLGSLREELVKLQAEKQRLEEVAAEADRGTAKGRDYEEVVAEAVDALALAARRRLAEAVGDLKESTGKKGDVVVAIGGCHGPGAGPHRLRGQDRADDAPQGARGARRRPRGAQRRLRRPRRALRGQGAREDAGAAGVQRRQAHRRLRPRPRPARAPGRLLAGPGARAHGPRRRRGRRRRRGDRHRSSARSSRWRTSGASASSSRAPRPRSTRPRRSWAP